MIYIDPESAVRGEVVRLSTMLNNNGAVIEESFASVFGSHWCDVQPLSDSERVINEQLKIKATHKIYPEIDVVASVSIGDFYRINGSNLYRIVESFDYKTLGYFRVWDGAFGVPATAATSTQKFYSIDSVPPGVYTFGTGLFASVPAFSAAPQLLEAIENSGLWAVTNVTATGFTVVDQFVGDVPSVTIYLWSDLSATDRFYVTGLTAGDYTFGSGALAHIAAFSQTPDIIGAPRNTGWYWIENPTQYGFTIKDGLVNDSPVVTLLIRAKPTATERRWSFSGLGAGTYTFGTAPLSGMPSEFVHKPLVLPQPNNSGRVFRPTVTTTGFTITWTGEGDEPSVTVMIQEV